METIKFVALDELILSIPQDRTVTHARTVIIYRLQKKGPNRVHIIVGGNPINHHIHANYMNSGPHNFQGNMEQCHQHAEGTFHMCQC